MEFTRLPYTPNREKNIPNTANSATINHGMELLTVANNAANKLNSKL